MNGLIAVFIFLLFYVVCCLISRWMMRRYFPEEWDKQKLRESCFYPLVNFIMIGCGTFNIFRERWRIAEAKKQAEIDQYHKNLELFIKHHGYTKDDVNEYVESLSMIEKFLDSRKGF